MKNLKINLKDTKLFTLYFYELWWLAHSICKKCDNLFEETKIPDKGFVMQVNPEIHSIIASLLSDASNIKKLIDTPMGKLRGESSTQAKLRKERAELLNKNIKSVELTEMLNHKIRNTLEHFDEYLDEANLKFSRDTQPLSPMAAYNMVFSHWEVTSPRVYPIRLYISSERKFYNMKWSVDIGKIYEEATAILSDLKKLPEFSQNEDLGGLMLRLD
ncbi:MAG: hypothetical protein PHU40_00670 [Sulfurimonas sp.]|nr:hypothetical protein [Sulfurimonas sp.]